MKTLKIRKIIALILRIRNNYSSKTIALLQNILRNQVSITTWKTICVIQELNIMKTKVNQRIWNIASPKICSIRGLKREIVVQTTMKWWPRVNTTWINNPNQEMSHKSISYMKLQIIRARVASLKIKKLEILFSSQLKNTYCQLNSKLIRMRTKTMSQ